MPRIYGFSVSEAEVEEFTKNLRFLESVLGAKSKSKAIVISVNRMAMLIQKLCMAKRDKFIEFADEYNILCKEVDKLRKML